MTFDEYMSGANRYFLENKEHIRYGQALINYLSKVNPKLGNAVPWDLDPYYNNDLAGAFLAWVSERFEETIGEADD